MSRLLHIAVFVLLSVATLALGIGDAFADRRVALVVGNSKYNDPSLQLPNPGMDAADMAAALRRLQFEVVLVQDATVNQMDAALQRFAEAAAGSDTVLFYYAGHALQFQGNNYLMPVDASSDVTMATQLQRSMVTDAQVRDALDRSTGVKIMILDACRNNPYADKLKRVGGLSRAIENTRGLARIDKTQGAVIAYAAAPGDVASDGDARSRNSPYTTSLLRWLQEPAVEISTMFRRVTSDVWETTKGKQQPEYTSTLRNDYFLDPLADQRIWERIRDSNDPAAMRDFIKQFPSSMRALEAQNRLRLLTDGQKMREEELKQQQIARENEQRQQALCRREGEEYEKLRDDLPGLQATVRRWSCPQLVADANARIKAIIDQREQLARDQAKAAAEEKARLAAQACNADRERVEAQGDDLAGLQSLARQPLCDPAKTLANDRIKIVTVLRAEAERKKAEAQRVCDSDQKQLNPIWNDVAKLQAFKGTCEQVIATAAERVKSLIAEAREREQVIAAQNAAEKAENERKQAAARQEAERVCTRERADLAAAGEDLGKLQDLQDRVKCPEMKPSLAKLVAELDMKAKAEQKRQQDAAFKLAALEEQQNEIRRREEQRARTEAERAQADLKCKSENEELGTIEADLVRLREFVKRIGCEEVRALTRAKIVTMEKEEKVCRDDDKDLGLMVKRARAADSTAKLIAVKKEVVKFEQDMNCARLRRSVKHEIVTIGVKLAQVELKRLACYKGDADGVLSDSTREAVKLFLTKISRPDDAGEVGEDLLTRLADRANAGACKPEQPESRPAVASRPAPRETEQPPRKPTNIAPAPRRQPEPSPQHQARPTPTAPAAKPVAQAPRPTAPSGGGVIGLH
jgi:hypothetical protein